MRSLAAKETHELTDDMQETDNAAQKTAEIARKFILNQAKKHLDAYLAEKSMWNYASSFFKVTIHANTEHRLAIQSMLTDLEKNNAMTPRTLYLRLEAIRLEKATTALSACIDAIQIKSIEQVELKLAAGNASAASYVSSHIAMAGFLNHFQCMPWVPTKDNIMGSRLTQLLSSLSMTLHKKINVLLHKPTCSWYGEGWLDHSLSCQFIDTLRAYFNGLVAAHEAYSLYVEDFSKVQQFYERLLSALPQADAWLSQMYHRDYNQLVQLITTHYDEAILQKKAMRGRDELYRVEDRSRFSLISYANEDFPAVQIHLNPSMCP